MIQYLAISYVWTWAFWLLAYFFSRSAGYALKTDATLFDLFTKFSGGNALFTQIVFALGVFGPLAGYLVAAPRKKGPFAGRVKGEFAFLTFIIPIAIAVPGILLNVFLGYSEPNKSTFAAISSIALYFVSNILTSGTEEYGWRGFLYPDMREREAGFWRVSVKSGFLWAFWHYPLMIILYLEQGPAMLLPSLAGFTAGIVAMAYISNFIYEKTASIGLSMFMHALNNTVSFAVVLFFPKTPFVFLSGIITWVVVGFLEKKIRWINRRD